MAEIQAQMEEQDSFGLEPPKELPKIDFARVAKAAGEENTAIVKKALKSEMKVNLDAQVEDLINKLTKADAESPELKDLTKQISSLAVTEIKDTTRMSNRMLDKPVKTMMNGPLSETSSVGKSLIELRKTINGLDPSKRGNLFSVKKVLGFIPWGNKVDDYFKEYQSSQKHINEIIETLYRGKDELLEDNASIEVEKEQMWTLMGSLEQYIYVTKQVDKRVEEILPTIEAQDPMKAKVVKEDILFYLRQKRQDLSTHLAVTMQGYQALGLIEKNNTELVKGVDRATTTTISALRTAVTVSQALGSQKLVLDQINAVNKTTESLIEVNAKLLGEQALEIQKQSISASINPEVLAKAFQEMQKAMDSMDKYKLESLDVMKNSIANMESTMEEAKKSLDRNRQKAVSGVLEGVAETENNSKEGVVTLLKKTIKI